MHLPMRLALSALAIPAVAAAGTDAPSPILVRLCSMHYLRTIAGTGTDNAWDVAVDSARNTYVTGFTDSDDLPTTVGAYDRSYNGNGDGYVIKLDADGAIVYATYLGGTSLDQGSKIAVDGQGNVYVAGYTFSTDFPVSSGAYDVSFNGGIDAFVVKLNAAGSALTYGTYLGGDMDDYGGGLAVDGAGRAYVTGYSESASYPTTPGAYDTTYGGGGDVIVTKVNATGTALDYSTFAGGASFEGGYGMAVDLAGNAYVSGQTASIGFPTTPGAFQPLYGGGTYDGFAFKLSPSGGAMLFGTFAGGSQFDDAKGLAVAPSGAVFLAGRTESPNYPTTPGAFQQTYRGGRDIFVTKLSPTGATAVYSTFVGGNAEEEPGDIAVDAQGILHGVGWSISPNFPVTANACQRRNAGDYDAVHFRLGPAGDQLLYGTYIGQAGPDYGRGVALDVNAKPHLAGHMTGAATLDLFACRFR